jgi:hypothetical protein
MGMFDSGVIRDGDGRLNSSLTARAGSNGKYRCRQVRGMSMTSAMEQKYQYVGDRK